MTWANQRAARSLVRYRDLDLTLKAIIAGGGVAGLAAAGGLVRLGWDVTVFEQAQAFDPVGAGILLAPNGVRALDWLGLGDTLRQKSFAHGDVAIRHKSGRWLLKANAEKFQAHFGVPSFALHRAELHALLLESAKGARLCADRRVRGVHLGKRPVVRFDDKSGVGEDAADLVIGADGLESAVRKAIFPDHPGLRYADYITWRAVVPAEAAPPGSLDVGATETWDGGDRFGVVRLGDGRVYWFAGASSAEGALLNEPIEALKRRFRGWHDPIPALLAATPQKALLAHDIYDVHPPLPRYNAERVVLIGDAAHAVTPDIGQGGCQALEDAVTLIDVLARVKDVPAALAMFDSARRERTQKIARISALWGRIAQWRSPFSVWFRNTATRAIPAAVFMKATEETLGWHPPGRPLRAAPKTREHTSASS